MTKKIQLKMNPSQAEGELLIIANILLQLRDKTKFWEEHYGCQARTAKLRWETQADKWIEKNVMITEIED